MEAARERVRMEEIEAEQHLDLHLSGMSRLTGTRELVELSGLEHGFDVASTNDIFTWSLMFLDAELGNQASKAQFAAMKSVAGGGEDSVVIYYNGL